MNLGTQLPQLTERQRAEMKPWMIAGIAIMCASAVSYIALTILIVATYFAKSAFPNVNVLGVWALGTGLVFRCGMEICSIRCQWILGEPLSWRSVWSGNLSKLVMLGIILYLLLWGL